MAPEILNHQQHNYKCDLWSIGVIIYRLIFGKVPFFGETEIALNNIIDKFGNNLLKSTGNKELDNLIKGLLEKVPEKRLNWEQYLNHPFFRDKINLIFEMEDDEDEMSNIFGEKFVDNNKDNIELIINGEKSELVYECKLNKGINHIEIIIKRKLNNLEFMFYECDKLKKKDDLNILDVKEINNLSYMFSGCEILSDIRPLENWNVSNVINFSNMFSGCESLLDIKSLEKWNVSNGKNFSYMFSGCESLSDLKPLQKWNVSKGNNFSYIFRGCKSCQI